MSMKATPCPAWVTGHPRCYCCRGDRYREGRKAGGHLTPWTGPLCWAHSWALSLNPLTIPAKEVPFSWFAQGETEAEQGFERRSLAAAS